jgi:hypothetical protein
LKIWASRPKPPRSGVRGDRRGRRGKPPDLSGQ